DSAVASGANASALGANTQATSANSVAIGNGSVANAPNTISFGSSGNERRLVNIAPGMSATDAVNLRQFEDGLDETLAKAEAYTDTVFNNGGSGGGSGNNGEVLERFGKQDKRINAMGAMSVASMAAASNIDNPECEHWRDCLGRGSLAAGVGHLEGETAAAVMYSQALPNGSISLGVSFVDGDVAPSLGVGFRLD
nr:hypothetical protein [Gammaproteobacteria bacterium]